MWGGIQYGAREACECAFESQYHPWGHARGATEVGAVARDYHRAVPLHGAAPLPIGRCDHRRRGSAVFVIAWCPGEVIHPGGPAEAAQRDVQPLGRTGRQVARYECRLGHVGGWQCVEPLNHSVDAGRVSGVDVTVRFIEVAGCDQIRVATKERLRGVVCDCIDVRRSGEGAWDVRGHGMRRRCSTRPGDASYEG